MVQDREEYAAVFEQMKQDLRSSHGRVGELQNSLKLVDYERKQADKQCMLLQEQVDKTLFIERGSNIVILADFRR